jgi:hypothetical protein
MGGPTGEFVTHIGSQTVLHIFTSSLMQKVMDCSLHKFSLTVTNG